jgi:hypothetical protein
MRRRFSRNHSLGGAAVAGLIVFSVIGCGGGPAGPPRIALSGKATYGGTPIPFGEIIFTPDEKSGNKGPAGTAVIENGKYQTTADQGAVAGPQIAIVKGYSSKEVTGPEGRPLLFSEARVPVTVEAGKTTIDIDVPKKDKS